VLEGVSGTAIEVQMELQLIHEKAEFDPVLNLARDAAYLKEADGNRARVWRSDRCVVLGRFLKPEVEVHLHKAEKMKIPVLKRASGGGAVYHDLGNLNYSLYLDAESLPLRDIKKSLRALSYPVTALLESLGVSWRWVPPNNIYVEGRKISGSAQARRRGRILHHGTLLVASDLDLMQALLKPGGRSSIAPVINLADVMPGITVERVERMLAKTVRGQSEKRHESTY
jgi:lipoate-protein ligase A